MTADPFVAARAVADAVLYEGYVLYPYRASARKNQLRWQFGVLVPPAVAAVDGSERAAIRTEVPLEPHEHPRLSVRIRCLQVQRRAVEARAGDHFEPAESVDVDGTRWVPWDEAVEHEVDVDLDRLDARCRCRCRDERTRLAGIRPIEHRFALDAARSTELLATSEGEIVGRAVRQRERVEGLVRVTVAHAGGDRDLLDGDRRGGEHHRLARRRRRDDRDAVMSRSLLAVHTLLAVDGGAFVSLLDPPAWATEAVAGCDNRGTFPVLVGGDVDGGPRTATCQANVVLSSPIILYDHPAVAPESAGDFCDATEIDEILALRVLTLTDDEKAEARGTDRRAAAIVDRCDDMPPEVWERLHGAVRSLGFVGGPGEPSGFVGEDVAGGADDAESLPWWDPGIDGEVDPWTDTTWIGGVEVGKGTLVRLRPSRRADAHDLFLAGLRATVAGVFRDVDGEEHVAVTVDDDPANEMLAWQGRFLYFHPDEIEVLPMPVQR